MCSLESNQHDVMEPLPPLAPLLSVASHILVIRPGADGDTLLAFPVIQAIRKAYNNPLITFAVNPTVMPLALATSLVDEASDFNLLKSSSLFSSAGIHS